MAASRTSAPRPRPASTPRTGPRHRAPHAPRRRRGRAWPVLLLAPLLLVALLLAAAAGIGALVIPGPGRSADAIIGAPVARAEAWRGGQPGYGVDISFPQCGRTFRDQPDGFAIIGLDGGMPDRPNPCFAEQWRFAERQRGVAVYVNTADSGRGDPRREARRNAEGDLAALAEHGVQPGTPVWLDVELPEVWNGSQERHRVVIAEHLRILAEAGYPVGVYSAPALWQEITGGAALEVPTWVGIGRASAERAERTCRRESFGGRRPAIVQRIGTASDGKSLDRNVVCPGTDLTGLVRPT